MDHNGSEERDIESGGTGSDDESSSNTVSGNKPTRNMLGRLRSGFLGHDGYVNGECSSSAYSKSETSSEDSYDNIKLLIGTDPEHNIERQPLLEKKHAKGKRKSPIRKASKPPRPPKGPTLDVSDLKLVMEISELAMKKRARMKRIRAINKMKAEMTSSSPSSSFLSSSISGSIAAMVVTLLFFIVILFQGILSRQGSSTDSHGSPEPATLAHGLISVRLFNSTPVSEGTAPSPLFPKP